MALTGRALSSALRPPLSLGLGPGPCARCTRTRTRGDRRRDFSGLGLGGGLRARFRFPFPCPTVNPHVFFLTRVWVRGGVGRGLRMLVASGLQSYGLGGYNHLGTLKFFER